MDSDFFNNWTVQLRKGVLELCVLNALEQGECYGYDLIRRLLEQPGLNVTEGTLYPLLSRLRVQGLLAARLVESPEGPARKYYALTDEGRRMVREMNAHLDRLIAHAARLRKKDEA